MDLVAENSSLVSSQLLPFTQRPDSSQGCSREALPAVQCWGISQRGFPWSPSKPAPKLPLLLSVRTQVSQGWEEVWALCWQPPVNPGGKGLWESCCPPSSLAAEGSLPR